ncbi:MAG: hypothetical protein KDA91_17225 [Planctomycetaceae bacterium]|nr:hypothetical protein [Planctomycetaceae bacterium]
MKRFCQSGSSATRQRVGNHCWRIAVAFTVTTISIPGCGRSETSTGQPADTADVASASSNSGVSDAVESQASPKQASRKRGRDEVWVDENGQKWFGNVPYDVFFDQPLSIAANQTPVGGGALVNPEMDATENIASSMTNSSNAPPVKENQTEAPVEVSGGAAGWGDLISATDLDDEVKTVRNFLNENLQSVGNFNSSMLMIPPKAATIGVLAGVAMQHPDAITWKDDANYVRDIAKQMNASTLQRGAKDQRRILALYEAMSDTLNRSRPADLAEPPEGDTFADVSEMRLVMMRMEEAEKRMRTEAGSESSFGTNKDMVRHEASILATMTRAITQSGYGYEDDPEFVKFAEAIVDASIAIREASESGDFATYELSLSRISTNCQACHSQYKND